MTPAAQKSRIYFLWDFVGRTLQYLYMVDYAKDLSEMRGQEEEVMRDAIGREALSVVLVNDRVGKTDWMVDANCDVKVQWGEEVARAAGPLRTSGT